MLTCIIIDDEQHAIDLLTIHIKKIDDVKVAETFTNPLDALKYLEHNQVDFIFLDIEMHEISGLDFMKVIKKKTNIVVTSAFKHYAFEGYENEVVDYLLKPVAIERLLLALQKVKAKISDDLAFNQSSKDEFIILKTDSKNKLLKVDLDDILYIEGLKNYISVFTPEQRIVTLLNMKSLESSLPKDRFIRTHNSFIIAFDKFKLVDGNQIYLQGVNRSIPISEGYKKAFFTILKKKLIENK